MIEFSSEHFHFVILKFRVAMVILIRVIGSIVFHRPFVLQLQIK